MGTVSDTWYVDPIPPYVDWKGRRWTWDGVALDPEPPCEPSFLDAWPDDLKYEVFRAAITMQLQAEIEFGGRWPIP